MELRPSTNPVIFSGDDRVFGPGPAELLERTRRTGSLHAAAGEMGMAYSKALRLVRNAEGALGYPLLERTIGGASGGGSALTYQAELLLARYGAWREKSERQASELFGRTFSRMGCVVMASGEARRFGSNKLLAPCEGQTVLARTLAALPDDLLDVRVVTRSPKVAELAETCGARAVLHDLPLQSDTIRAGLSALPDVSACLFVPGDQPLLSRESVRALVLGQARNPSCVVRLSWQGRAASPVVFPRACFYGLRALQGDEGGSALLRARPDLAEGAVLVEAAGAWELMDVDTPDDLARVCTIIRDGFAIEGVSV